MWSGKAEEDSSLRTECSSPSQAFSAADHLPSACMLWQQEKERGSASATNRQLTASSPREKGSRIPPPAQQEPLLMDKMEKGLFSLAAVKCLDAKVV